MPVLHGCRTLKYSDVQDDQGRWNQFTGQYSWDESCVCSGDESYGGTGKEKEGSIFGAAPNIDHTNERVRQVQIQDLSTSFHYIGGHATMMPAIHDQSHY